MTTPGRRLKPFQVSGKFAPDIEDSWQGFTTHLLSLSGGKDNIVGRSS